MKEKDLIALGFEKTDEETYYYYTLDIGNDYTPFCLISNADDELKDGEWFVQIFDYEAFKFTSRYQLEKLLEVLKHNIK